MPATCSNCFCGPSLTLQADHDRLGGMGAEDPTEPPSVTPLIRWDLAKISIDKFACYSMNPSHPQNKGKHCAFKALGFDTDDSGREEAAEEIIRLLRAALPPSDASPLRCAGAHGKRTETTTTITGPNGRTGKLVAVWQIPDGSSVPELITNWLEVFR